MPTPFVVTTMFMLTVINNAGQLAPLPKEDWPLVGNGPIFFSESGCAMARGHLADPTKYVCQGFKSSPTAQWMPNNANAVEPPPADDHASLPQPALTKHQPLTLDAPAKAQPEMKADPLGHTSIDKPEPPKEAPAPRKVAQRPRYEQQGMFNGNMLAGLFAW